MFHKFYSDRDAGFWRFFSDTKVFFGRDEVVRKFPEIVALYGSRVGVLTDKTVEKLAFTGKFLSPIKGNIVCLSHIGLEADYADVKKAAALFRENGVDAIAAIGGGSVLDGAKFTGAAINNDIDLLDFEACQSLPRPKVPVIAVPTTFGTSSEVNQYVFINDRARGLTISFKKDFLAPETAIVNPDVLAETPERIKYLCGIDSFVHALEVLTLKRERSPVHECLCRRAVRLMMDNFRACVESPAPENEEAVAVASVLGGIGINNSRPGLIHTLANRFAKQFRVSHPVSLLPFIMPALEFNRAHLNGVFETASFDAFIREVRDNAMFFETPELAEIEAGEAVINLMAEGCMLDTVIRKENPAPLDLDAYRRLYSKALKKHGAAFKKGA